MREKLRRSTKYLIGLVLGGLAGYLYYRFVGCVSGTCPITSNPYISTAYCALTGVVAAGIFPLKPQKQQGQEEV